MTATLAYNFPRFMEVELLSQQTITWTDKKDKKKFKRTPEKEKQSKKQ